MLNSSISLKISWKSALRFNLFYVLQIKLSIKGDIMGQK